MLRRLPLFPNGRPRSSAGKALKPGGGPKGGGAPWPIRVPCPESGTVAPARSPRPWGPVLGLVHAQGSTLQVLPVHQRDRLLGCVVVLELHEGEASGTSGLAVGGHLRIHDLAGGTESLNELLTRDVEAQVAHKHLIRNGRTSSSGGSRPPVVAVWSDPATPRAAP